MENYRPGYRANTNEFGYQQRFYHHHEQRSKGSHRLHAPVNFIDIYHKGHKVHIRKDEKPEGISLTGWLVHEWRFSPAKAKDIARMFQ